MRADREVIHPAGRGDAPVMRPLLLHASSQSTGSSRRRVLHFVFKPPTLPDGLQWRHAIQPGVRRLDRADPQRRVDPNRESGMDGFNWVLFFIGVLVLRELAGIGRSLQSTAAMTHRLLAHHGIEWGVEVEPSARVKALSRNPTNRLIAIQAYRQQTGLGVREAKAVVDALLRTQGSAALHGVPADR